MDLDDFNFSKAGASFGNACSATTSLSLFSVKHIEKASLEITVNNVAQFLGNNDSKQEGAKVMAGGVEWYLKAIVHIADDRRYLGYFLCGTSPAVWRRWALNAQINVHKIDGLKVSMDSYDIHLFGSKPLGTSWGRRKFIEKEG